MNSTPLIGITLGDVTGVGPEVTLKALAARPAAESACFLLIGDKSIARQLNDQLKLGLRLADYCGQPSAPGSIQLHNPLPNDLPNALPPGHPAAAQATVAWLRDGAQRCLRRELAALVTAPVSKESIIRSGQPFIGQTEFLSEIAGDTRTVMMLLGCDDRARWLRVALVTTHLPIKDVARNITAEKVQLAVERAAEACRLLGLSQARVGVCGLNPHAGEGGKMGDEEIRIITPAIQKLRAQGLNVQGPLAADTLFHYAFRGDFDVVVAMYHDQGLAPLKMIGFDSGVNWTLGLKFIRTSPDHGTAYDIAGKGIANFTSMQAAINLALKLA